MTSDERHGLFLKGALILTAAGLISKILGSLYRIPLTWLIGPEGMGLFQMAYPLYLIFLALSTAGLPVAVSKLVAERAALHDRPGVQVVLRSAVGLLTLFGAAGALALYFGARPLAARLYDPRAYYTIIGFAPAVFMMSLMSAWRGYFQGRQQMKPVAVSQIIEQIVRVGTMLALAALLVHRGVERAAAGVAFGGAAGAGAGLLYLLFCYWRSRVGEPAVSRNTKAAIRKSVGYSRTIRRLTRLAWPIALGAVLVPLIQTVDSILVPSRLAVLGLSPSAATAAMGHLGNAWALVVFPTVITAALSTSLVPAISDAQARKDRTAIRSRIQEAYRIALIVGLPAAAGLWVLNAEIARLLFSMAGSAAAIPLKWLAPATLLLGLQQASSGALQGLGRPGLPVRHFLVGAIGKLVLTHILVAQPEFGVRGAAAGTLVCSAVTVLLNTMAIRRLTGAGLPSVTFPAAAGAAGVLLSAAFLRDIAGRLQLSPGPSVMVCIMVSVLVYGAILVKSGAVRSDELAVLFRKGREAQERDWGSSALAHRRMMSGQ